MWGPPQDGHRAPGVHPYFLLIHILKNASSPWPARAGCAATTAPSMGVLLEDGVDPVAEIAEHVLDLGVVDRLA